jgi:D-alanyl-D-alanine carboxypeptidase (penicillin-binding protein 5/6)
MNAHDVELYNQYAAVDGSLVPVYEGQKITEYQALQAMMLPSANNISDSMAIWAFGSLPAYTAFANNFVKTLGMERTTVGSDASGFSPSTVSTAADLVRLGNKALANPVLAEIVGQSSAVFPGYGTIENVNTLLGQYGIRGIKTGNTDEAGGCFLAAADITVAGQKVTVITAIMAANTRGQAMRDSLPMIQSAVSQFQNVHIVDSGQTVGRVASAWGESSDIVATNSLARLAWSGKALTPSVHADALSAPVKAGTKVGKLDILTPSGQKLTTPIELDSSITKPTLKWRLTHPL